MPVWTLEDIERQAARGGVNRQQAEQLVAKIRDLSDAIIAHRDVWANSVSRDDPRRDDANDDLWSLVDGEDG